VDGGVYDRRPCAVDGFIKGSTSGFYFDEAGNISIRNCSVQWGKNRPGYFTHAVESNHVSNLDITGFAGVAAFPEKQEAIKK